MRLVKCKCGDKTTNAITNVCDICIVKEMMEKIKNDENKNNKVDKRLIKRDR